MSHRVFEHHSYYTFSFNIPCTQPGINNIDNVLSILVLTTNIGDTSIGVNTNIDWCCPKRTFLDYLVYSISGNKRLSKFSFQNEQIQCEEQPTKLEATFVTLTCQ